MRVRIFKVLLFASVQCMLNNAFGQTEETAYRDSLKFESTNTGDDSIKIALFIEIGDSYEYSNPDSAIFYYNHAANYADELIRTNPSIYSQIIKLKTKAIRYSGYTSWNIGKYSYALSRYFEALEICTKTGDLKGVYNCFNNIGIINQKQLNYENAEKYYLQALNTADLIDDELGKSQVYINLGNLFMDKGDSALVSTDIKEFYGKSFDYYKKALPIKESAGDARGVFLCYNNMGNLVKKQGLYLNSFYDRDKLFSEAHKFYHSALNIAKEIGDDGGLAMCEGNLAHLHIQFADSVYRTGAMANLHRDSAFLYSLDAFSKADITGNGYLKYELAIILKSQYSKQGDYKNALFYADQEILAREQLFAEEQTMAMTEMMTKYETQQKDLKIQNLNSEKSLKEIEIAQANKRIMIIVAFALILSIMLVFVAVLLLRNRKSNKMLTQANEKLNRLNKTKNRFFSILSHDLRGPVYAYNNISSLVYDNLDNLDKEQLRGYLGRLRKSSSETYELLQNLLFWANSQDEMIKVNLAKSDINALLNKCADVFTALAQSKAIKIENIKNTELLAWFDSNLMAAVIRNLIGNAVKFSVENSIIRVGCEKIQISGKDFVKVFVEDAGIGINPEELKSIFAGFADSGIGDGDKKGSGLGLVLCKEFVEKHGGEIFAESTLGEGTKVWFVIPKNIINEN